MFSAAIKTAAAAGGYQISRSLRFNSADSAYLARTFPSAGNQKTWTWSAWLKLSAFGSLSTFFERRTGLSDATIMSLLIGDGSFGTTKDALVVARYSFYNLITTQVFRDPSAWYHIVLNVDTTQATSSNRMKLYVNGQQITAFSSSTYPSLNEDLPINAAAAHDIGRANFFNGYMTDVNFIDGQALTPSSFGQTNAQTGVWEPVAYSGSYGTNGFYLNFSDNSNTTAATLGKDYSGNGNNWTPNNFSVSAGAGNDSLVDTPTPYGVDTGAGGNVRGNYATWNPVDIRGTGNVMLSLANGNLQATGISSSWRTSKSTIGMSSGKWYCEATLTSISGTLYARLGLANSAAPTDNYLGVDSNGWAFTGSWSVNDVIGIAFDADAGTLAFYLNNSLQGTSYSGLTSGPYFFAISIFDPTVLYVNFGQRPFAYTAPSGFKALCTQNLPTPTIGATTATQAGNYFIPTAYTGNGSSSRAISNGINMAANGGLVWTKQRSGVEWHFLIDNVRGNTKYLSSNATNAEGTISTLVTSFDSTGYSIGNDSGINSNGSTYVSWVWGAGGSGVTNTAGSITSTVSANTTSGFSIVTYTGTGIGTVGHGLGVVPSMVIVRNRSRVGGSDWAVWHKSLSAGNYILLNTTAAQTSSFAELIFGNGSAAVAPSSTVISVGGGYYVSIASDTYVAYCFAEIPGYSAFGSYTGNGSSDGPFIFTGFRPAFVLIKCSSATSDWWLYDTKRGTFNVLNAPLYPNGSFAESPTSALDLDILSNGFKSRSNNGTVNGSGNTYIYAAFAESPFKYALAR
jgi:hypothetical protein